MVVLLFRRCTCLALKAVLQSQRSVKYINESAARHGAWLGVEGAGADVTRLSQSARFPVSWLHHWFVPADCHCTLHYLRTSWLTCSPKRRHSLRSVWNKWHCYLNYCCSEITRYYKCCDSFFQYIKSFHKSFQLFRISFYLWWHNGSVSYLVKSNDKLMINSTLTIPMSRRKRCIRHVFVVYTRLFFK